MRPLASCEPRANPGEPVKAQPINRRAGPPLQRQFGQRHTQRGRHAKSLSRPSRSNKARRAVKDLGDCVEI